MSDDGMAQHETVVKAIERMISEGQLRAGDRLPVEPDLAEQLGVSRGSLREGVRALVAMGVLETRQGSGTRVTSLDPRLLLDPLQFWVSLQSGSSAADVHRVRCALEVEAAGLAAGRADAGRFDGPLDDPLDDLLDDLDAILASTSEAVAAGEVAAAAERHRDFHARIALATGNPVLAALIDAVSQPPASAQAWPPASTAARLVEIDGEHRAIRDRLAQRDQLGARAAMRHHLTLSAPPTQVDAEGHDVQPPPVD